MTKLLTQRDRILQYIKDFGFITSWDAYRDLGVTQLATRIYELKERGYKFRVEFVPTENRYGKRSHYYKYFLEEDKENEESVDVN